MYIQNRNRLRHRKQTYGYQREKGEGGEEGQIRSMGLTNKTTIHKIDNKDLLYSTRIYTQYFVITYNGI